MQPFSNWTDIEQHLSTADNQTKGELFEQITESYLKWSPKYQVILKKVWRLKDIPSSVKSKLNIPNQDQGIDLIAETFEGKFWAIQCKYHGNIQKKISHREISTFLALSNTIASNIDFCLVATTADDYAQLYKGQSNIGFLLSDTWTHLPPSFFDGFGKKEFIKPPTRNPRPHQIESIAEAKKHFTVENRGKLIFPCGAGKSLTGYWITKELKAKTVIVAVPSLALVKQTLEDYCQESFAEGNPIAPFCICSDEGIGKNDDVAVFTQDMGVVCTTDKAKILDFLNFKTNRTKVIFTTYQSGRVLGEAVKEINFKFDVGIMDESHKTVGATDKLFSHLLFDENVAIEKRIFMTATERRYRGSSENILSMDDPGIYGETFTQLSFKEAINQKILSDYKILTLVITKAEIKEYLNQNNFVKALGLKWDKDIDFRTLSSLIALRKAMQKFPIKHAVTFHSSIKRAKIFEQLQPAFDQAYPSFEGVNSFHVTGAIPTGQRSKIISEFSQADRGIITNAKCLTEGVDVPNIDCVLFADPRKSSIDIVQAVGRALRRSKGKEFGYILLPVYAESNDKESIIESEDFQAILQTLRALAANDERIIEYFREKQKPDTKSEKSDLVQFDIDEIIGNQIATDELLNHIELQAWSRLAKLSWRPFRETRDYVHSINFKNVREFESWKSSELRPLDIPSDPKNVYSKAGWKGYNDFLGTTNKSRFTKWRGFEDAREYIRSLKLESMKIFQELHKNGIIPSDIPSNPHNTYRDKGWLNIGDWLGTHRIADQHKAYRSFKEARTFVRSLNLKSRKEWMEYCKSGERPEDIPTGAWNTYKDQGWDGLGDFLGIDRNRVQEKVSYIEARKFARSLNLKSSIEWNNYQRKNELPKGIPRSIPKAYIGSGWISWNDFLGFETTHRNWRNFMTFTDARRIVRKLSLKSHSDWMEYTNSKDFPSDIPKVPWKVYKNDGYTDIQDFLGFKKGSYEEMKIWVIGLGLQNEKEWRLWKKYNEVPSNFPKAPESVFKDKGWKGWADFLGKEEKE